MSNQVAALVVAAGRGTRMSDGDHDLPKQYLRLGSKSVLAHTLDVFLDHPRIQQVLTVRHPDDETLYESAIAETNAGFEAKLIDAVPGGATRQQSVFEGLRELAKSGIRTVLIHDAARPFVDHPVIDRVLRQLDDGQQAVLTAVPVFDTLKRTRETDTGLETVDRTGLWSAQTPQGFAFDGIFGAHSRALEAGRADFTDDTAVAEWAGLGVVLSEGNPDNFKITTQGDLERADRRIQMMERDRPSLALLADIRVGNGYDVHAFEDGRAVILGGVEIPHDKRLKGHSDADVVLHAITDAMLGAIADGDIGTHFPPSDPTWKGASSDQFLKDALRRVTDLGGQVAHIDVTIVCEMPKIGPHREDLRNSIAKICALPVSRISVKATTSERLGFTGRKEGIAALSSVTVRLPFHEGETP